MSYNIEDKEAPYTIFVQLRSEVKVTIAQK